MGPIDGTSNKRIGFFEAVRRELRLRNYSHKTIKAYVSCLRSFVRYFHPQHPRERYIQDLLGHQSVRTTEIYTHAFRNE